MADTFGKFKDSFNRGIASIGAKASTSVEKSKLKTQIETCNKEADAMMTDLGRTVYAMWKSGNEDYSTLVPRFEAIKAKYDEIQTAFNELKAIEEKERLASQPAPAPAPVYAQPVVNNNVYAGQPVPVVPQQPVPVYNAAPVQQPVVPVQPVAPVSEPVQPVVPVQVSEPAQVVEPVTPVIPVVPMPVAQPVVPVAPASVPAQPVGCVCPNCGASYETEVNFCRMCGTKIK